MNDFENYEIEIKGDLDPETRKELIQAFIGDSLYKAAEKEKLQRKIEDQKEEIDILFIFVVILLLGLTAMSIAFGLFIKNSI
jgi:uncharacterized protein YdgA (DUF945 family)